VKVLGFIEKACLFLRKRASLFLCRVRCSALLAYVFEQSGGEFVVWVLRHKLAAKGFGEDGLRQLIHTGSSVAAPVAGALRRSLSISLGLLKHILRINSYFLRFN